MIFTNSKLLAKNNSNYYIIINKIINVNSNSNAFSNIGLRSKLFLVHDDMIFIGFKFSTLITEIHTKYTVKFAHYFLIHLFLRIIKLLILDSVCLS